MHYIIVDRNTGFSFGGKFHSLRDALDHANKGMKLNKGKVLEIFKYDENRGYVKILS